MHISPYSVLLFTLFSAQLVGAETWTPSEHPAVVTTTVMGFTQPRRSMHVAPEVSGRISMIAVDDSDLITENNNPVVSIDATFATIAMNQADLAAQQAALANGRAQQALQSANSHCAWATAQHKRIEVLATQEQATHEELDAVQNTLNIATAQLHDAQLAHEQTLVSEQQAKQAHSHAKETVLRHAIHAPAGWQVRKRLAQVGSIVQIGEPILEIVDVRSFSVSFQLSTLQLTSLKKLIAENNATLSFPQKDHQQTHPVIAMRIEPGFNQDTRKHTVFCDVNADGIRDGLEAQLHLQTIPSTDMLTIPSSFVALHQEQYRVTDTTGKKYTINPLSMDGEFIIITARQLPASITLTDEE